jgi:hypothetical protein
MGAIMPVNSLMVFSLLVLFFAAMLQIHLFEIAFAKLGLAKAIDVIFIDWNPVGQWY